MASYNFYSVLVFRISLSQHILAYESFCDLSPVVYSVSIKMPFSADQSTRKPRALPRSRSG